jgi:tetratricopeptide (TPR) repeat protein
MSRVEKQDAEEHFSQAMAWEVKNSFPDAVREYELTIKCNEHHPKAHLHLGFLYASIGELDLALKKFERAREVSGRLDNLLETGTRSFYLRKVTEVIEMFSRPTYSNPTNSYAHYRLALAAHYMGRTDLAAQEIKESLELNPRLQEAYIAAGNIFLEQDMAPQAIAYLKAGLELNPKHAEMHYLIATCYDRENSSALATQHMEKAVEIEPESAAYYLSLGRVYARAGKHKNAIKQYQKSIDRDRSNPKVHFALAESCTAMHRPDLSIQMLREAVKLDPNFSEAHYELGVTLLQTGQPADAVQSFRHTLDLNPNDSYAHYHLAESYVRMRRFEEAIHHFWQAATLNPQDGYAHYNLARALDEAGRPGEAIPHLERAVEVNPNDPSFQAALNDIRERASQGESIRTTSRLDEAGIFVSPRAREVPNPKPARDLLSLTRELDETPSSPSPPVPSPELAPPSLTLPQIHLKTRSSDNFLAIESLDGPILWDEDDEDEESPSSPPPEVSAAVVEPEEEAEEPAETAEDGGDIDTDEMVTAVTLEVEAPTVEHEAVEPPAPLPIGNTTLAELIAPLAPHAHDAHETTAATQALPLAPEPEPEPESNSKTRELPAPDPRDALFDMTKINSLSPVERPGPTALADAEDGVLLLREFKEPPIPPLEFNEEPPPTPAPRIVKRLRPDRQKGAEAPSESPIALGPPPSETLFDKGVQKLKSGELEEARALLQEALEFDENDFRAIFFLSWCARLCGDKFIAFQLLQMGLELARSAGDEGYERMYRAALEI